MIQSLFIREILELIIDTDDHEMDLMQQMPYLTDNEYQYTGFGLFVYFSIEEAGKRFRIKPDERILSELKISSPELVYGGEAILFIKGGLISYLDIMGFGDNYSERELAEYTIWQDWPGSNGQRFRYPLT